MAAPSDDTPLPADTVTLPAASTELEPLLILTPPLGDTEEEPVKIVTSPWPSADVDTSVDPPAPLEKNTEPPSPLSLEPPWMLMPPTGPELAPVERSIEPDTSPEDPVSMEIS